MNGVVVGDRQVHAEQPLWRARRGQSVRRASLNRRAHPESPGGGRGRGDGARVERAP